MAIGVMGLVGRPRRGLMGHNNQNHKYAIKKRPNKLVVSRAKKRAGLNPHGKGSYGTSGLGTHGLQQSESQICKQ